VIRSTAPDLVTLNEVCRNDVAILQRALAGRARADVAAAFQAAADRRTGGAFRCRNGQPYGIGLLALISPAHRYARYAGVYPIQDTSDPEERVWLCLDVTEVFACTTHLASTKATVALGQCRYLLDTAIPGVRPDQQTVLGGDFNLRSGRLPSVRSCQPSGYVRVDDGGTQDVMASAGLDVRLHQSIDMHGTTDHPGLLVALTAAH
jgi:endonuclease/exonuclease/phosphatase family metal-dependent hydrolase